MDLNALKSDPEFVQLPFTEKVKAIAMLDKDFARLDPAEQHKGLAMLFPPDAREAIAERSNFPPPTAAPQPQAGAGRRFLQGAGVPTSFEELGTLAKQFSPFHNPEAAGGPALPIAHGIMNMLGSEMGTQAGEGIDAAQAGDYKGAMKHALGAAVPVVGPPVAEGNVAGAAGRAAGLLAPMGVAKAGEVLGPMLERAGTPPAPLSESIGSLVAQKGRVINPTADIEVPKFNNAARHGDQLSALAEKYPNSDIMDKGDSFVVKAEKAAAPKPTPAPKATSGVSDLASAASNHIKASTVGGGVGFLVGGPPGAAVGAAVANTAVGALEAAGALRSMMRSPLWKATSGALKTEVGKAMQAQDFSTVAAIGSRVLAGENLNDEFGHDSALHGLIDTITQHGTVQMSPPEIRQALDDYDAVYVSPNGASVPVPFHVAKQMKDKLGGQ